MRVAVTIDDTVVEIEDPDMGYTHESAAAMLDTAMGRALTAYEASAKLIDEPTV